MNHSKGTSVIIQFPLGLRLGGTITGVIQQNDKDPIIEVAFLAGGSGQFPITSIIK